MDLNVLEDLVRRLQAARAQTHRKSPKPNGVTAAAPDVLAVRAQTGLSQSEFAQLLRVSTRTLQNWEEHRRSPIGPAAALIKIVASDPEVAIKALRM